MWSSTSLLREVEGKKGIFKKGGKETERQIVRVNVQRRRYGLLIQFCKDTCYQRNKADPNG